MDSPSGLSIFFSENKGLSINPTSLTIEQGSYDAVTVSGLPEDWVLSDFESNTVLSSTNTSIANPSFGTLGYVTVSGVSEGTATITIAVTVDGDTTTFEVPVTVTAPQIHPYLSPDNVTVKSNEYGYVYVYNMPVDWTDTEWTNNVTVSGNNASIATVEKGMFGNITVMGVTEGTTTANVSVTIDGNTTVLPLAVTVDDTVVPYLSPSSVTVAVGLESQVAIVDIPYDWSQSDFENNVAISGNNTSVATVEKSAYTVGQLIVTGVSAGTTSATVAVTMNGNTYSLPLSITVINDITPYNTSGIFLLNGQAQSTTQTYSGFPSGWTAQDFYDNTTVTLIDSQTGLETTDFTATVSNSVLGQVTFACVAGINTPKEAYGYVTINAFDASFNLNVSLGVVDYPSFQPSSSSLTMHLGEMKDITVSTDGYWSVATTFEVTGDNCISVSPDFSGKTFSITAFDTGSCSLAISSSYTDTAIGAIKSYSITVDSEPWLSPSSLNLTSDMIGDVTYVANLPTTWGLTEWVANTVASSTDTAVVTTNVNEYNLGMIDVTVQGVGTANVLVTLTDGNDTYNLTLPVTVTQASA